MRQGSSGASVEPASCPIFPRSHSNSYPSESKLPSSDPVSVRPGHSSDAGASTVALEFERSSKSLKDCRSASIQRDASSLRTSLDTSPTCDSRKTLPTRPKVNSDVYQHPNQSSFSAEENRLDSAAKPPTQALACKSFLGRPAPAIEVNVARSRCHPRRRGYQDSVQTVTPKLRRDTDCTDAIVRLIVFFSTKLVHTIWSQASATPKTSKDFNGAGVLPLQVFIQETLRRSKTSYSTLQVALFYLILLRPHVKPCQATQQQYTPGCRALQCGRRMFLTALILASKYLQDRNYSARAWSKISGLPVAEINENERHYLELIKYNLHMSKETFENWSRVVLTICKTSGQGPLGGRPDSPPSSPEGLSFATDVERPGSSGWWSHHLIRLTPEVVKTPLATEQYLVGLAKNAPCVDSTMTLETPPSSPESLEEVFSVHGSPLVLPSAVLGQSPVSIVDTLANQNTAPTESMPSRPVPPNLPTPQTTPRYDSAFMFAQKPSRSEIRHRLPVPAMAGTDSKGITAANLETCPPPRPRFGGGGTSAVGHPLKEHAEPALASWLSSPESSFSDSSSYTTRSRSSSISSVSSVWSVPSVCASHNDSKHVALSRADSHLPCVVGPPQVRANIGSYGFYHSVGSSHPFPENSRVGVGSGLQALTNGSNSISPRSCTGAISSRSLSQADELGESQIAQLLACLRSESDDHGRGSTDPAVVKTSTETKTTKNNIGPSKKHKRTRSSKEDVLQEEVRQFLWNEQTQVCVEDDKKPTTCVETSDKQAQYPLQQWAHAKKPIPNVLHNKRIALQHSSSNERKSATELASEFLRQSVTVM